MRYIIPDHSVYASALHGSAPAADIPRSFSEHLQAHGLSCLPDYTFMSDLYGDRHYKERIREYCSHNNIQVNSTGILWGTQELEHGGICAFTIIYNRECELSPKVHQGFQPLRHPEKEERLREISTGIRCTSAVSCSEASMTARSITIIRNFSL